MGPALQTRTRPRGARSLAVGCAVSTLPCAMRCSAVLPVCPSVKVQARHVCTRRNQPAGSLGTSALLLLDRRATSLSMPAATSGPRCSARTAAARASARLPLSPRRRLRAHDCLRDGLLDRQPPPLARFSLRHPTHMLYQGGMAQPSRIGRPLTQPRYRRERQLTAGSCQASRFQLEHLAGSALAESSFVPGDCPSNNHTCRTAIEERTRFSEPEGTRHPSFVRLGPSPANQTQAAVT